MSFIFEETARIENIHVESGSGIEKKLPKSPRDLVDSPDPISVNLNSMTDIIGSFKMHQRGNSFAIIGTQPGEGCTTRAIQLANLLAGCPLDSNCRIESSGATVDTRPIGAEIAQFFTADFQHIFAAEMLRKMQQDLRETSSDHAGTKEQMATPGLDCWGTELPTLLIDANWLHPGLDGKLGLPRQPGLIELINGAADWHQVLYPIPETSIWAIPTGDLAAKGCHRGDARVFRQLLDRVRDHFNYVIIDCCPPRDDRTGLQIATAVDGVIMVLRAGFTRREMAQHTKQELIRAQANILGVMMTPEAAARK